jgi:hypothetical protein
VDEDVDKSLKLLEPVISDASKKIQVVYEDGSITLQTLVEIMTTSPMLV